MPNILHQTSQHRIIILEKRISVILEHSLLTHSLSFFSSSTNFSGNDADEEADADASDDDDVERVVVIEEPGTTL
jgi:hypothetical protein